MRRKTAIWFALLASTCLAPLRPSLAGELPAGPSVVHGSVGIAVPNANTLTMQQSSAAAIVNWQSFSVGSGASVNIQQPSASSALLNRVTGAATSTIAGQINANGQVYLVNPNGIVITPTGTVRAGGGFVASTLGIGDDDFKAGRRNFSVTGSSAAVVNQGTIEVGRGGYAALLGGSVENAGTISVPMGRVGLGAGERATLDISGDGFLQVAVPSGSAGEKALIQHSGRIRANGGRVEMQAATAREVARQAINLTGVVEARTVGGRSGAIVLGGGAGGTVTVSGRLDASATRQARRTGPARSRSANAGKGGEITITGDRIGLDGAKLDASGRTGGGTIKIGGDLQGGGSLPHARRTIVDDKTTIAADATENGNGGRIILWSDEFTGFGGLIRARGGPDGGDGGFAEVSSKGVLGYNGQTILTAAKGKFGTLLLDPYDVYIDAGPPATGSFPSPFTPTSPDTIITVGTLEQALATANVVIQTTTTSGTQDGNITLRAPIVWGSNGTLALTAANNIVLNGAVTAAAGGLTLNALGTITASEAINVGTFTLGSGAWTQSGALPAFSATDFRLQGGSFLRVLGGDGSAGAPYRITDVYGLQGINSAANLPLSYQLANDIDASGTRQWNRGEGGTLGFVPIGGFTPRLPSFSGALDGRGHTISGLFINRPDSSSIGLFGSVGAAGTVTNLSLTNVDITGNSYVGAVAGQNSGTISQAGASGTISGVPFGDGPSPDSIGGLVGLNFGTIRESNFAGTVSVGDRDSDTGNLVSGGSNIGGLVGWNLGTVSSTHSTATVNAGPGSSDIGGLVGRNDGNGASFESPDGPAVVEQSYSTGTVNAGSSSSNIGGLAGVNFGSVTNSYSSGTVSVGDPDPGTGNLVGGGSYIGGLIGFNLGPVSNSYSAAAVNAGPGSSSIGGLVGFNESSSEGDGTISRSYATGAVSSGAGSSGTGGLVGTNYGSVSQSYSAGSVSGGSSSSAVGGLIGENVGSVTASFWDTITSGQLLGIGTDSTGTAAPRGLTTTEFQDAGFFVPLARTQGWNFETDWAPPSAGFYPELYAMAPVIRVVTGNATRPYGDPNPFFQPTYMGGTAAYVFSPQGDTLLLGDTLFSPATATSPIGSYPILGTNVTSTLGVTYRLVVTQADAALTPSLAVTPAPLTLAANSQTKVYGSAFAFAGTEFSATGLRNGETVGAATLSSAGAAQTAGAGPYSIAIGGATGGTFNPSNYAISYTPGTFLVTPAPLTVTANNQSKTYGSPFAFAGTEFSATGLQNGETVGSATLSSGAAAQTAGAGPYSIAIGGATGGTFNPSNYAISYTPGTFLVTPAPLTVTANNQSKTYGSPFAFAGTEFSATGLQNGETVGSATLSSAAAAQTAGAGPYSIAIGGAAGGTFNPSNYAISYTPGSFLVTPAPLTVTANNQSKTYGSPFAFAGTEFSATGLQNGERVGSATLSSAGAPATANASLYPVLIGDATGGSFNPSNYNITYIPGTMAVTPAPLIVAADNQAKMLGLPFPFTGLEFTALGLRNGETVGAATLFSTGAAAAALPGIYPILSGNAAGGTFNPANYAISYVPGAMIVGTGAVALTENARAGLPFLQLPTTTIALPNPPDSFDLNGGGIGGGGPTLGTGRPGELDAARSTLAAIERSSNDLEAKVANCESRQKKALGDYKSCVGDALEQFADALDTRTLNLPGPMRGIPAVIRQAARQVRAARTVQEARAAVGAAIVEVRKAIALIRADDPAIGQMQLRQANRIASALGSVETRLARATGL